MADKNQMTLLSLFDGSGGFCLAGMLAGIRPVAGVEIEPFPIRVTTKRLPFVKHYGDVSTLNGAEVEQVDVVTFGFPCQSVSIAGKREGVKHEAHGDDITTRSGLFYEAVRIIKEMRDATHGRKPRYAVAENVPGLQSSKGGEDFRAVLESLCELAGETLAVPGAPKGKWLPAGEIMGDGYSVAWRILDAQRFGVPQRRKRVYIVADLAGQSAGKILFDSSCVSGYSTARFRSWQEAARGFASGVGEASLLSLCLNDQGGERMDITVGMTGTLRAQAHHPPVVISPPPGKEEGEVVAGFCTEHSANSRGIGYEEETSPTLRAGVVPAALMFENHSQDTRYTGPLETAPTVSATYGTGGNNQPFVVSTEEKEERAREPEKAAERPAAFGISSFESHAMLSDNPHAGIYEAETARTLDTSGGTPACNQGGIAIVETLDVRFSSEGTKNSRCPDTGGEDPDSNHGGVAIAEKQQTFVLQGSMIGRTEGNGPQGSGIGEEVSFTLTGADRHAVAFAGEPSYTATCGSFMSTGEDVASTLQARDYKDPQVVSTPPAYVVRRLTPVECARLQGFPDKWCDDLGTENPTEEEIAFWTEVFEEHRRVVTHAKKPKTRNQIVKWLKDPYTDSAVYTLYWNGIALPCAWFVLAGIVWAEGLEEKDSEPAEVPE